MDTIQALVLPYRKKLTQMQYLLQRELIPAWDQDKDLCGILVCGSLETIENTILATLTESFGYKGEMIDLLSLGVCAGDRTTSNHYYLYAIDLTKAKVTDPKLNEPTDDHFWASEDILLESLDAQLLTCYAKLQFVISA